MLTMKYFGISLVRHKIISQIVSKNDEHCHEIIHHSKNIFSKIKFRNFQKLTVMIIDLIRKEGTYLKRRFDSKQPAFFLSPHKPNRIHRNPASFFIKNVREYKDSLRKKDL